MWTGFRLMAARHFLRLRDLDAPAIASLLERANQHHADPLAGRGLLAGRVLVMLFEKKSTRTRVSFEAGMAQMGGHAIFLSSSDSQLSRGELPCAVPDTFLSSASTWLK
ncbi:MAG: hypothetical protein OXC81_02410, partial [Betaproteobacteria bacterium]|nr:hypothetical protein [Betaproteobacteria bacterium]